MTTVSIAYAGDREQIGDPLHVLGTIALAGTAPADLALGLPGLDGRGVREVWRSTAPVRRVGVAGLDLAVAGTGADTVCFGMIRQPLAEAGASGPAPGGPALATAAYAAYAGMLAASREAGCPNLLRIANFIPDITRIEHGEERYRSFNAGRRLALVELGYDPVQAPAACGLGCRGDALLVWFLAGAAPGCNIDNPRQVSPLLYPDRYGVHRPVFARATVAAGLLMVSGTASIVGHASLHEGDVSLQADETIRNLDALLAQAGGLPRDALTLKLYLRHARDRDVVVRRLRDAGFTPPVAILQSEICRPELDLEIEAQAVLAEVPVLDTLT